MRLRHALPLIMIGAFVSGCALIDDGSRNLWHESFKVMDDATTACHIRRLAVDAWLDYDVCHGEEMYSRDYAKGFRKGYADYLSAGDLEAPPSAPPWRYRRPPFESPEGHVFIQDWYDGYHAGVIAGRASGQRPWFVLPSSGASLKGIPFADLYASGGTAVIAPTAPEPVAPPKPLPPGGDQSPVPEKKQP